MRTSSLLHRVLAAERGARARKVLFLKHQRLFPIEVLVPGRAREPYAEAVEDHGEHERRRKHRVPLRDAQRSIFEPYSAARKM